LDWRLFSGGSDIKDRFKIFSSSSIWRGTREVKTWKSK